VPGPCWWARSRWRRRPRRRSRPPGAAHRLTLLLAPGTPPARALHAAAQADARIVWASQGGSVWVLALPEGATPASGYRAGVLALGGRWAAAACAGWGGGGRRLP